MQKPKKNLFSLPKSTESELERLVEEYKILDEKNHSGVLEAYFNRYRYALENKVPMKTFIKTEEGMLDELFNHLEFRIKNRDENRNEQIAQEKEKSAIDKILGEYKSQIKHYPKLKLPANASDELAHLFGGIKQFHEQHWEEFKEIILTTSLPSGSTLALTSIEDKFLSFVSSRTDQPPYALERYLRVLRTKGTKEEIITESQNALKDTAFFLIEILDQVNIIIDANPENMVARGLASAIETMLMDFRIANFKRANI